MKIYLGKENSCKLNYQHIYIYYQLIKHFDITDDIKKADIIVIAESCCCTNERLKLTLNYFKDILQNKKPNTKVYLTGCITRKFKKHPDLNNIEDFLKENFDYIIPQNQPNLLLKLISEKHFGNLDSEEFGMFIRENNIVDLFISNGCLNNCTFCKKSYQNYPLKSMDLEQLKYNIDYLNDIGCTDIYLKGTNICQYGIDIYNEYKLPEIIDYLEKRKNIKNVSLVGFAFKDAIKNDFKTSIQKSSKIKEISGSLESGSNRLLKLINKGFTSEEIIDFITDIRKNYFKFLRLCIIAGFPTETLEDVKKTLNVLEKLSPQIVDICRYANSPFVASNKYEQLSPSIIQEHTRIYSKTLQKRQVKTYITGYDYLNN